MSKLSILLLVVFLSAFSSAGSETITIPLTLEPGASNASAAMSEGGAISETSFDAEAERADLKTATGVVYQSYRPGSVWFGAPPEFIAREIEIGGEELLPLTDVYEDDEFLYAHYGPEHYQTKAISVIDVNRRELVRFTAFSLEDISRLSYDPETEIVYFSTLEGNLDGAEKARIHAFSLSQEELLWSSDTATAHGDFLVLGKHILSKYGFTGIDDFVFLLDKGNGKTVAKHQVKTAAAGLIEEGDTITAPCYTGVVTLSVSEK